MSTKLSGALLETERRGEERTRARVGTCLGDMYYEQPLPLHTQCSSRHSIAWEICCSSPEFRCSDVQETGYRFQKCILILILTTPEPRDQILLDCAFVGFDLVHWSTEGAAIPNS